MQTCALPISDRDHAILRAASQWIRERRAAGDQHLFTWVHLMGPHLPYDPQPFQNVPYARLFADPAYAGTIDGSREVLDAAYAEGRELSPADVARVVALYDGEIARVNALISLFVLGYADRGSGRDHLEDTLVVFAGDHGEELHQRHGYWGHSKSVYSSVLHVPLFFRHPGSLTGKRVFGEVVGLEDVAPTVLDWFDVALDQRVSGRSLLPLVDGEAFESRPAFGHWRDRIFTVRTKRWRLVLNPDGVTPEEEPPGPYPVPRLALYDLEEDPRELFDVSDRHPEVVEELRRELDAWLARLEDPPGDRVPLSDERRRALADLGYAGDDASDASDDATGAAQPSDAPRSADGGG